MYLVTPEINPGLEWVFRDPDVYAVEKMHGTGLSIEVRKGHLTRIQNRKNVIDFTKIIGKQDGLLPGGRILEGVLNAAALNYVEDNTIQYGEFLGPSMNKNIHKLDRHLWYPFKKARTSLRYKSFNKHPRDFFGWSEWFRTDLKSMLYCKLNKIPTNYIPSTPSIPLTEGLVFYLEDKHDRDKVRMAKLRRDMMYWYYSDKIEVYNAEEWMAKDAKKNGIVMLGYN